MKNYKINLKSKRCYVNGHSAWPPSGVLKGLWLHAPIWNPACSPNSPLLQRREAAPLPSLEKC